MKSKIKFLVFILLDVFVLILICSCSTTKQACTRKEHNSKCGCNPYLERLEIYTSNIKEFSSREVKKCIEDAGVGVSIVESEVVKANLKGCLTSTYKMDSSSIKAIMDAWDKIPPPVEEFKLYCECKKMPGCIENRHGVILMDSHIPDLVYCEDTRRNGGSNSDDILKLIEPMEVIPYIIPTNIMWLDEDRVIKMSKDIQQKTSKPALIIIHASAFYEKTMPMEGNQKLLLFLESLKKENVRILVYTRGLTNQSSDSVRLRFNNVVGKVNELAGKAFLIVFDSKRETCFDNPVIGMALKNKIRDILDLDETEQVTNK